MTTLVIIAVCLVFSAFFSGMEIAFISANKLHIEVLRQQGSLTGKVLSRFVGNRSHFLGTTLVGNNLALVLYGVYMASWMEPWLVQWLPEAAPVWILVIQTLASTVLVLVTAEFLPKSIFLLNPDGMLQIFALPMAIIYYLMFPVTWLVAGISRFIITKVFRFEYSEDRPVFGLTDLSHYLRQNLTAEPDKDPEVDTKILHNAIEFKTVKVRECMIPRTEIAAVEENDSIEDLRREFIESGHSKIIVYRENIDDIIGYCHSLELFKKPAKVMDIINPIIIVPETMPANELMVQFITERKSLAWVVDEYGGTSGIVSMEDVMEEIFGEIQDEHDDEDWLERKLDARTYELSARHEIEYLNEAYGLAIPEGDYDTLGGWILAHHGNLPVEKEEISIGQFLITVTRMEDSRIDTVKLQRTDSLGD
jgi:putative hemolysin